MSQQFSEWHYWIKFIKFNDMIFMIYCSCDVRSVASACTCKKVVTSVSHAWHIQSTCYAVCATPRTKLFILLKAWWYNIPFPNLRWNIEIHRYKQYMSVYMIIDCFYCLQYICIWSLIVDLNVLRSKNGVFELMCVE